MADVTREELIDQLATQLGIAGAESREARWTDERWQRRVLQDALAALTRPASPSDVETVDALIAAQHVTDHEWVNGGLERANEARAAVIARMRGAAVPEGWKLVPVEPTPEMRKAAIDADDRRTGNETCAHIYRAMLAAAPEVPR